MFKMHLLLIKEFKCFSHFNLMMLNYLCLILNGSQKNASVRELLALTIYYNIKILHKYHIIMKVLMYLYLLHRQVCLFNNDLR